MRDGKNKKGANMELNVLYEDNHIIVVEKPVNIPSQADKTGDEDMLSIIKAYLKEKYNKPGDVYLGLVHRLDRPTGGVMVFAKTSKAASRLSEQVRNKDFHKQYLAIVDGKMENSKGTFKDYLVKNEKTNMSRIASKNDKNAKEAILDYEVVKYNEEINMSVVKVNLHTGRHHQIRVQFASRNHSLSGDQKYGTRGRGKQLALWAYSLSILHPITKSRLEFTLEPAHTGSWKILDI
jgi:23S rRNA pseudouridine1911/1915/1917 synthase